LRKVHSITSSASASSVGGTVSLVPQFDVAMLILSAASVSFAQGNGNAIGGGSAGGPGAKAPEPTAGGGNGNDTSAMMHKHHMKEMKHKTTNN
jgi:hypothetical protein